MQWRRKKKFIDAKSQLSFAGWIIMLSLVFTGLVLVVLFIPPVADWFNPGVNYTFLMHELFRLLAAKWLLLILIAVIMIFFANLFSHRLVGPEYRFRQVLHSLINKDLNFFIKLRKWDYHKGLEPLFKQHASNLKESISKMKKDLALIEESLNKQDTSKAKETISNLKKELESYKM
jgi:hypothetical protein